MSQLPQNLPLSRDQVLDEVEFLLTVEHALIVEYLSVRCALGNDLDTAHGGPVTEASREAAAEANARLQADAEGRTGSSGFVRRADGDRAGPGG